MRFPLVDKFNFGKNLVLEAGSLLKLRMTDVFDIKVKTRADDLVTSLDFEIQHFIMERIQDTYPKDNFLAEEGDSKVDISEGSVWVIDPIDGTVNFIAQKSEFAIMLSYFLNGNGQFAFIYDVMADNLYSGGLDFPVNCNGRKLLPFDDRPLSKSLVACNTGMLVSNSYGLADKLKTSLGIRNYGCAGISMAKVLENQLWGYFSNLYPWDYAAPALLGEQLGYRLCTITGEVADYKSRQELMFVPTDSIELFIQ